MTNVFVVCGVCVKPPATTDGAAIANEAMCYVGFAPP